MGAVLADCGIVGFSCGILGLTMIVFIVVLFVALARFTARRNKDAAADGESEGPSD